MKNAPKNLEYMFPNPKRQHNEGELVIWNRYQRFGDMNDNMVQITSANYKMLKGKKEGWYYSIEVQKFIKTRSPGVPEILIPHEFIQEIPEEQLMKREEILKY